EAIDALERGVKAHDADYELRLYLGSAYYYKALDLSDSGRPGTVVGSALNDATRELNAAIRLDPKRFDAYVQLGMVQAYQSDFDPAEKTFRKALEVKPDDLYTWSQLGDALYNAEQYAKAAEAYGKMIAIDPKQPVAWQKLGFCQQFLEKTDKAEEA